MSRGIPAIRARRLVYAKGCEEDLMRMTIAANAKRITTTVLITGTALAVAACGSTTAPPSPAVHTATPRPAAAAATAPPAPLACGVHAGGHAIAGTLTGVRVRTAPHAWIVVTAHYASRVQAEGARASALGRHTFSYSAGRGHRVVVEVHASLHGRDGSCQTSFRAHQPPPPPPPMPAPTMAPPPMAPPMPAPTPSPTMMM
jgi:hypothetical protein